MKTKIRYVLAHHTNKDNDHYIAAMGLTDEELARNLWEWWRDSTEDAGELTTSSIDRPAACRIIGVVLAAAAEQQIQLTRGYYTLRRQTCYGSQRTAVGSYC